MISLFGKWMFAENDDGNPLQEFFVAETEEGDWLLVDVELTNDDAAFLKDYIVIPVIAPSQDVDKPSSNNAARKGVGNRKVEKFQRYFHGKLISRMVPRKMVQPYKIERPLKYKAPAGDMQNAEQLQQMASWLEMMSVKIPRARLGTLGNIPTACVNVKSLKLPIVQVIKPTKPQPKNVFLEDLNTCKSVVPYEPSPVKKLLWDLGNITQKRTIEFVAGIGEERQSPMRMTLRDDHVYELIELSIRKRRKFNSPSIITELPDSEPTRTPLLALEWQAEQPDEWPADFKELLEDDEEESWFAKPAMAVISEICEMTSKLGHRVPKAAMFLWAHFLQLISCSKKFLSCEESEDEGSDRREAFREAPRGCCLSLCYKDFSEERNRALAQKKIKKQDTKKSLKRAHGALIQKHHDNTNRKRAMDSGRFQRGGGRRGC